MELRLLSQDKATIYGLKPISQAETAAIRDLLDMGFTDEISARQHIDAAILAGAFERVGVDLIVTDQFRNDEARFVSADQQGADGKVVSSKSKKENPQ